MNLTATEKTAFQSAVTEAFQPNAMPPWLLTLFPIIMKILASLLGGLTPSFSDPEKEQLRGAIAEAIQPNAIPDWLTTLMPIILKVLMALLNPPPPSGN